MDKVEFTAMQYADDVLEGRITVCKWVRLAVERHIRDLETGAERGFHFNEAKAKHAIAFFSVLKHSKGRVGRADDPPGALAAVYFMGPVWLVAGGRNPQIQDCIRGSGPQKRQIDHCGRRWVVWNGRRRRAGR